MLRSKIHGATVTDAPIEARKVLVDRENWFVRYL